MGTPDFAAVVLERVLEAGVCDVVGVYTQPDRPCGRGRKCAPSAVKKLALEHGLPVFQPVNFKSREAIDELRALKPDILLVAAYGLILPQAVLDAARLMPMNVHASLLPKYRGAAPIQRAIMDGEIMTGITIMRMEAALDSGPILLQKALVIGRFETAGILHDQLADMGGRMLAEAVERLPLGKLPVIPQDNDKATYAQKIDKKDAEIRWDRPAEEVHNQIRAMSPKPGAYFHWRPAPEKEPLRIQVAAGKPGEPLGASDSVKPGDILGLNGCDLAVACADKTYLIQKLRPAGKRVQTAEAFACGYLNKCDDDAMAVCGPDALESADG